MKENEKNEKLAEYYRKVTALFGHLLWGYDCKFCGDTPVMQVVYCDYKPSSAVRDELHLLMPEVELAEVRREISDSARMTMIREIAWGDYRECRAEVTMPNGDRMTLSDWAVGMLYDEDLSDAKIPYDDTELVQSSSTALYRYLHE